MIIYSFLTTSLSITLLSLLNSAGIFLSLSISTLPGFAFKLSNYDFPAKLDVSTPVAPFKSAFVA